MKCYTEMLQQGSDTCFQFNSDNGGHSKTGKFNFTDFLPEHDS